MSEKPKQDPFLEINNQADKQKKLEQARRESISLMRVEQLALEDQVQAERNKPGAEQDEGKIESLLEKRAIFANYIDKTEANPWALSRLDEAKQEFDKVRVLVKLHQEGKDIVNFSDVEHQPPQSPVRTSEVEAGATEPKAGETLEDISKRRFGKTLEQIEQEHLDRSAEMSKGQTVGAGTAKQQAEIEASLKKGDSYRKFEESRALKKPKGLLEQAKKDLSGITTKGLEYKLNKAKTPADISTAVKDASKLLDATKKDFAEKSEKHNGINSRTGDLDKKASDKKAIEEHARAAYFAKNYPKGLPENLSSKAIEAIDQEVKKQTDKEYKELKDAVKDIQGDGILSKIRGKLSDEHKSLDTAHQTLTGLDQKLTQLEQSKNELMSRSQTAAKGIELIEKDYQGIEGWFKKQAHKVFGDDDKKQDLRDLKTLYDIKKSTKEELKSTAKEFDRSMKGYLDARDNFDKVSARTNDKLEKHQAKFEKYSKAPEHSKASKELEERRAQIAQEKAAKRGQIQDIVGSLTKQTERGTANPTAPAVGRGTPEQKPEGPAR